MVPFGIDNRASNKTRKEDIVSEKVEGLLNGAHGRTKASKDLGALLAEALEVASEQRGTGDLDSTLSKTALLPPGKTPGFYCALQKIG